jgi:hypothetical protein
MLKDSDSLQSDYRKFLEWYKLPETVEVLQYLQAQADQEAGQLVKPPSTFRVNNEVPEMAMIRSIQDRAAGRVSGLRELSIVLAQREVDLVNKLKQAELA